MNNKFIPILSVFMTISLIVFVSLQFYWLKEYYASLEQEFSNKVHIALENSAQKISEIEFNKYNEKFKNIFTILFLIFIVYNIWSIKLTK